MEYSVDGRLDVGVGHTAKMTVLFRLALGIVIAVIFQVVVQRYLTRGFNLIDPFLILTAYYGMRYGQMRGTAVGSLAGLIQDGAFSAIIGINGFSKTLIGFTAGVLTERFEAGRSFSRILIIAFSVLVGELCLLFLTLVLNAGDALFRLDLLLLKAKATSLSALFVFRFLWRGKFE